MPLFFATNESKYKLKGVSFGPVNDPGLYTGMMQDFRGKWHILFINTDCGMEEVEGKRVKVTEIDERLVGGITVH